MFESKKRQHDAAVNFLLRDFVSEITVIGIAAHPCALPAPRCWRPAPASEVCTRDADKERSSEESTAIDERDASSIPVRPAGTTGPMCAGPACTAATHMGHCHMRAAAAAPMSTTAAPMTAAASASTTPLTGQCFR